MTPVEDWRQPAIEQYGLRRFLRTVRERTLLIVAILLAVVGLAVVYLLRTDQIYQARADVLVTPVPADQTIVNLGLITESADPTLTVQTAAQLIQTTRVADQAREQLGLDSSSESLLDDVDVQPVGQSNVVAIEARRPTAQGAAELANAFAESAVADRSTALRERVEATLPDLQAQIGELSAGSLAAQSLGEEIARLESFLATGDPTLRLVNPAAPPTSPVHPRPLLILAIALIAGLALGIGIAYAIQVLDPKLRREEQLRALFRLPILARIPRERAHRDVPLSWDKLSPGAVEAYRSLRATITAPRGTGEAPRSLLVTGAGPSEGKTTTAINLAFSLARSGARVILIEADLRRPAVGKALGISTRRGIVSVLLGETTLASSLISVDSHAGNVDLLLADSPSPGFEELFSLPTADGIIEAAGRRADFVVIDSPPLTAVVDALPLARRVDATLLVVRLGKTRLGGLKKLGELLADSGVKPAGLAVVGTPRDNAAGDYYHQQATSARRRTLPAAPIRSAERPGERQRG